MNAQVLLIIVSSDLSNNAHSKFRTPFTGRRFASSRIPVPDPFRLAAEGHATGLKILQPGEQFVTTIEFVTAFAK
jgi:hypothetical protein